MLDDQPVLVTEFVAGKTPSKVKWVIEEIGNTLGRIHALPTDSLPDREGGSLHHMPGFEGLPGEDLRLSLTVLEDIEDQLINNQSSASLTRLREVIERLDDCSDLPRSLVHPDPALVNLVADSEKRITLIDWAGCGLGPRIVCLAQVLGMCWTSTGWSAAKMQTLADAYSAHISLTADELERVGDAVRMRIVWLAAWNYWTRTLAGKPPKGDEWWLRRAFAPTDPHLMRMTQVAFGRQ